MSSQYLSVENFKLVMSIFEKYMHEEYGVQVSAVQSVPNPMQLLLQVMQHTDRESSDQVSNKEKNNIAMNQLRDIYLDKLRIPVVRKPRVKHLDRDRDVFGARPVQINDLKPLLSTYGKESKADFDKQVESFQSQRNSDFPSQPEPRPVLPFEVVKESALPSDAMTRALDDLEHRRNDARLHASIDITQQQRRQQIEDNPKQLYQSLVIPPPQPPQQIAGNSMNDNSMAGIQTSSVAIAQPEKSMKRTSYMMFNGYDREWTEYPRRYEFVLNTDELTRTLRNIIEVAFTRLILPLEVVRRADATTTYGLSHPYIMLYVDELGDVYNGPDRKSSSKSFTPFVYHREYRAPNGRGYLILEPLQEEVRKFHPNPLATLPRLSIRITKPHGALYNMSSDENSVTFLQYEAINPLLLRLTVRDFFDKNEFAPGDVVLVRRFRLARPEEFQQVVYAETGQMPSATDVSAYAEGIVALEEFMNRDDGHEIINADNPNASAALQTFAIYLPHKLDKTTGTMVVQRNIHNLVTAYHRHLPLIRAATPGDVINMSLQAVIAMSVKTVNSDITPLLHSMRL